MLQDNLDDCLAAAVSAQTDVKASTPDDIDHQTSLATLQQIQDVTTSMVRAIQGTSEL